LPVLRQTLTPRGTLVPNVWGPTTVDLPAAVARSVPVWPFVSLTPRPFLVSLNPPDLAALLTLIGNSQVTAVIARVSH
jgi:hypothetical protein